MNCKTFRAIALLSALTAASTGSWAQASASATATASVLIPIGISVSKNMVFGNIVPPSTGTGTVTLSTGGARTNDYGLQSNSGSTPQAAEFVVTGSGGSTGFSITYSPTPKLVTGGGGTATKEMAIDFITDLATSKTDSGRVGSASFSGGSITDAKEVKIYAGGILTVGSNQVAGTYTGSLAVTVAYN